MDVKFLRTLLEKGTIIPLIMSITLGKCDKCPLSERKTCPRYEQASIYCNQGQWEFCGIYKFYVKEKIELEKIELPSSNQSGSIQI